MGEPLTLAITAGALPGGLTLSTAGTLSETATAAATYTFTVTATGADCITGSQDYSPTVDPAVTSQFVVSGFPSPVTAGHVRHLHRDGPGRLR